MHIAFVRVLICEEMAVGKPSSLLSVSCQNAVTKPTTRFQVLPQANPHLSHKSSGSALISSAEVLKQHVNAKLTMADMVELSFVYHSSRLHSRQVPISSWGLFIWNSSV
jgi:hypothetical protein